MKKIVETKTLYDCEAKNKLGIPYLSMMNHKYEDGSNYTFVRRALKDSLKFVLVDISKNLIGVLDSIKPYAEEPTITLSSFGESLDEEDEDRKRALSRGLIEEAGYDPLSVNVKRLGDFPVSPSTDELATLFVVDVSRAVKIPRSLEEGELEHVTVWLEKEEDVLKRCDSLVQTAYLHLLLGVPNFKLA